jgi:hypothetical protein
MPQYHQLIGLCGACRASTSVLLHGQLTVEAGNVLCCYFDHVGLALTGIAVNSRVMA